MATTLQKRIRNHTEARYLAAEEVDQLREQCEALENTPVAGMTMGQLHALLTLTRQAHNMATDAAEELGHRMEHCPQAAGEFEQMEELVRPLADMVGRHRQALSDWRLACRGLAEAQAEERRETERASEQSGA